MENESNFRGCRIHIRKRILIRWLIFLLLTFFILLMIDENPFWNPANRNTKHESEVRRQLVTSYGQIPMHFEANRGQTDGRVKFLSRGRGYTLFLTSDDAVLSLRRPETGD